MDNSTGWLVPVMFFILVFSLSIAAMVIGWKNRSRTQKSYYGDLYTVPQSTQELGDLILSGVRGIYAGTVDTSSVQTRILIGDIGFRSRAELIGYSRGILLDRTPSQSLWIPRERIIDIRHGLFHAGKVPPGGVLIVRYVLPKGDCIDIGFCIDPVQAATKNSRYSAWIAEYLESAADTLRTRENI